MSPGPRVVVTDAAAFATVAASEAGGAIRSAARDRGRAAIALAGGETPRPVYARLARESAVPWNLVDVYFGDERCVPADDARSNYHMARVTLLDPTHVAAGRVHPMACDRVNGDRAAREYEAVLPDPLDVLMLGIGEDGHTASLFPGSAALEEHHRRVVAVRGPKPPPERLTITPPVIHAARVVLVFATGPDKAGPVALALEGPEDVGTCPAQLARRGVWVLDRAAAARLQAQR